MLGQDNANRIRQGADEAYLQSVSTAHAAVPIENEWLLQRYEAFKMAYYLICYRLAFIQGWDILAFLFILACIIDGQMRRRAGQWDFSYVSPMKRQMSKTLVTASITGLILVLTLPIPLPPVVLPAAIIGFGMALKMAAASLQKRV